MPIIPGSHGWFTGWPPENPKIDDEVIFIDKECEPDTAVYSDGYGDDGQPAWEGTNMDPTKDSVLCWRPFDAPV